MGVRGGEGWRGVLDYVDFMSFKEKSSMKQIKQVSVKVFVIVNDTVQRFWLLCFLFCYSLIYFSLPVRRYQLYAMLTSQGGIGIASIVTPLLQFNRTM